VRNELDVLKIEFAEMVEERDSWQSLAQEEEAKRLVADADAERLKDETSRLEAKAAALQHRLESRPNAGPIEKKADRSLRSYDDLEDWAEEVLGEQVHIHQAALKDCKKNGHQSMLGRIESALREPRIIAAAGNRGHLWGEQHGIETRTKRNHSWVNSGRLTIGGNYSRSPLLVWVLFSLIMTGPTCLHFLVQT
jgi:hypothetical protein